MTAFAVTVLLQILIDDLVDKRHAAGVVQLLGRVAGTLVHTGEVHIDNAYGTIVSRHQVPSYSLPAIGPGTGLVACSSSLLHEVSSMVIPQSVRMVASICILNCFILL